MNLSPRVILVLVVITLVILGLGGLVAATQIQNANSTRPIWVVNSAVAAGDAFTPNNVQQIKIAGHADQFSAYTGNPVGKHSALALSISHLLSNEDVIDINLSEVPISIKGGVSIAAGDSIDVYALFNGNTIIIGKHLIVRSNNPVTALVPTSDEPSWIALLANGVALYAAKSNGIGIPTTNLTAADAINHLSNNSLPTTPAPSPSPSAKSSPSPSPTR